MADVSPLLNFRGVDSPSLELLLLGDGIVHCTVEWDDGEAAGSSRPLLALCIVDCVSCMPLEKCRSLI